MCSRHMKKTADLMEKPKTKKTKTIQMKYPASYSQSWSGSPPTLNTTKKPSSKKNSAAKIAPAAKRETRRCCAPDPTLPHLKYGLFPKKNSRGQSRIFSAKTPLESNAVEIKTPRPKTPKEGESSAPLFVVRALDSRLTRRLSQTASTHLDIKPRNYK